MKNSISVMMLTLFQMKLVIAVLAGTSLQYLFALRKGFRVLLLIFGSSAFLALFVLDPLLDWLEVASESGIRTIVFSLSALISVELISLFIRLAPRAIQSKALHYLGADKRDFESTSKSGESNDK